MIYAKVSAGDVLYFDEYIERRFRKIQPMKIFFPKRLEVFKRMVLKDDFNMIGFLQYPSLNS